MDSGDFAARDSIVDMAAETVWAGHIESSGKSIEVGSLRMSSVDGLPSERMLK